jgi:single-strand DNA-binding protein
MNDTIITLVGNVVDRPRMRRTKNGNTVTNFRVASTSRRFDRELGQWVDNATLYINVTCWRAMGENVEESVQKGQPVIVTGRYFTREYTVNEIVRTSYELEATAVGHDLSRGVSKFERVYRAAPTVTITRDADGIPVDESDHWLGLAEPPAEHGAEDAVAAADADSADAEPGEAVPEWARSSEHAAGGRLAAAS